MTNAQFQRGILRALILLIAGWTLATSCPGQQNYYAATHAASLSSAADTVTVQATTSTRQVQFNGALVSCSVACTITVSQNGTAATTTALAITPLNLSPTPGAVAFSASNVGAGTTIATYNIATGDTERHWIDLTKFMLGRGSNSNLSVGVSSITGDSYVGLYFFEVGF